MKYIDSVDTFEKLVSRYIEINKKKFSIFLKSLDELKWAKDPFVSLLTEDCNKTRRDISEGGARYSNYGITAVGLANVVDSLFNIKYLVYKKKKYKLKQMAEARESDFSNDKELYTWCQRQKHYGHDNKDVICLVNRITEKLAEVAEEYNNKYGGTVKFGLSSPAYNMLSKKTAGDFSGRKAGMPYNTHISCSNASYTEAANFAGQLEYGRHRFNGNVVDYFINPNFLENNKEKFVLFMFAAIRQGFFQMQMNVMDSRTLIDAKANPEKYPGLIVRVWGFSALLQGFARKL